MEIGCVIMAAGASSRFGGCKLIQPFGRKMIFEYAFDALPLDALRGVAVVSGKNEILAAAAARGFMPILNDKPAEGPPRTIRLGIDALGNMDAIMFMVADQPLLTRASVAGLISFFAKQNGCIAALACGGRRGNPAVFPREFFAELRALRGERGGGAIMAAHPQRVRLYDIPNEYELMDIDTALDYAKLKEEHLPYDEL